MTLTLIDAEFCTLADLSFLPSSQVNWGEKKRGEVERLANPIKAQIKGMVNTEILHSH